MTPPVEHESGHASHVLAALSRKRTSSRGAALVIVLLLSALILLLVVMALSTSGHHANRARLVVASLEADALTRLPVNIVLSQLKSATVDQPAGVVWASQPGMIRTDGARLTGGDDQPQSSMHYRLYSAPVMNSPTLDVAAEAAVLDKWYSKPAGYTDLNEPVVLNHTGAEAELVYPVADPAQLGVVDGFALRSEGPAPTPQHPLPLPAAWMYVLQDGQLIMPDDCDDSRARFDKEKVTRRNPIVARIAFWTDDETCKLNLNTASEPGPWDMPAANTLSERVFAEQPPSGAEAYRMSTHPGYTSLSVVLKHFGGGQPGSLQWPPDASSSADPPWDKYLTCYQALVPDGLMPSTDGMARASGRRRFSTVDEFLYDANHFQNGFSAGFRMTPQDLRQSRFLLTTHASAPELNPFGQPKIALWMMPQATAERSAADRRVNACCRLPGGQEFVFQRAANWSSTDEQGSSQSMTADWSEVPRNRDLYAWLESMTDLPLPGAAGSFAAKYGRHSRDQILTSMLDMLRWSVNPIPYLPPAAGSANPQGLAEQSAVPLTIRKPDGTAYTRGFGRFPTITEVAIVFAFTDVERLPKGQPRDDNNDGICDRATALRAFMVLNPFVAASGTPAVSPAWSVRIRRLQHFTIAQGIGLALPGGNVRNRCTLSNTAPLSTGEAWGGGTSAYACFSSQFLQPNGQPKQIGNRDDPARDFPFISNNDVKLPGEFGRPGTSIRFSGGAIIVDLMEPNSPLTSPQPNDAIHSLEMEFPDKPIPLPSLQVSDFKDGPRKLDDRFSPVVFAGEMHLPILQRGDVVRSMILNAHGPSHGDARVVAAQQEALFANDEANRSLFVPHPDYDSQQVMMAQSLRDGACAATSPFSAPVPQTTRAGAGALLVNAAYATNALPSVPRGLTGAMQLPQGDDPGGRLGDWESGAGVLEDGPQVNRSVQQPEACLTRRGTPPASPQMPSPPFSPVNFGGIPSGIYGDATTTTARPWQTLLFCPNPAGRATVSNQPGRYDAKAHDHFGFASPPDHLWLEFFWQPITEPSPLGAGFATEGKVNMNFQVLPWTWLRRSTAMHGALQGVRMAAIPTKSMTTEDRSAKGKPDGSPIPQEFRYAVNADKTLAAFEQRFDEGGIFRFPSEICDMFLVPRRIAGHNYDDVGSSPADPEKLEAKDMTAWWNGDPDDQTDAFEATGDNLRESPYAQLYSRLCTQSNVFRVHYRVQVLKKARMGPPATWNETRDSVVSERRGNYLIERRFAPDAPPPDPAVRTATPSLHSQHKLVVSSHERFAP